MRSRSEAPASLIEPKAQAHAGQPIVELDGVSVRLGGRTVLRDLTLGIMPGEFVGLIGPNGAGKSTLLRVILGLQRNSAGSVRVFGAPTRQGNPRIGYVPQHQSLHADVPLRARDMVALGLDGYRLGLALAPRSKRERVDQVLRDVRAMHFADAPVGRLSGGEQQRLMLAQALVSGPDLLLLDEPLANLDLRSRREIVDLVSDVCQTRGIAVLFVAHDVNPLLSVMDKVLYLADGRGVMGTPDEVVRGDVLSHLFGFPVHVIRTQGHVLVTAVSGGDDCHA